MESIEAQTEKEAETGRHTWRYWLGGSVAGAVLCLGISLLLQNIYLEAGMDRLRYRLGLWEIGWAAILWIVGTLCAAIATAMVLSWVSGLIRREWIRWVLGVPAYLVAVGGVLLMLAGGGVLAFSALLDEPTAIRAVDGQRVFADLDYEGAIYTVRVRGSGLGYEKVRVPGSPDPDGCVLEAAGSRLELVCGGQRMALRDS